VAELDDGLQLVSRVVSVLDRVAGLIGDAGQIAGAVISVDDGGRVRIGGLEEALAGVDVGVGDRCAIRVGGGDGFHLAVDVVSIAQRDREQKSEIRDQKRRGLRFVVSRSSRKTAMNGAQLSMTHGASSGLMNGPPAPRKSRSSSPVSAAALAGRIEASRSCCLKLSNLGQNPVLIHPEFGQSTHPKHEHPFSKIDDSF